MTTRTTTKPDIVGSLIFCPECGNLLDIPGQDDLIVCNLCSYAHQSSDFQKIEVVTKSQTGAFPSALRNRRDDVQSELKDATAALVKEPCPKCGNPEMEYHTMQLRSADEGQTVFYTCPKCAYKTKLNS
ncbi:DNA-directed RNA polymerase I core subunit rpa12 [Lunasporangiospora selenospora]|uniref:DNA-directed RNA polymerase subunit n=1 Tax=Lunasporangiospora selenospora TaxID=979761 RepID=A0A9P6FQJ4_9FUNG|nr:DNA-directed RNA polymerase I core subunit rpa12 [Lunasporangiospora selenospora]